MLLCKKDNEALNDYIVRLGLKRQELDLSWNDLIRCVEKEFGVCLTIDGIRKRYKRRLNSYNTTESLSQKIIDKNELYKFQAEKSQLNNYYKILSREDTLKSIGIEAANIIANKVPMLGDNINEFNITKSTKTAILLIGDWHYGIKINSNYNDYDTEICKKRVEELLSKVRTILEENKINNIIVINLGDMIAGNIHLPLRLHSQTDVITQTIEVSEIISQFLANLGKFVNHIDYYSTLDNHSRIDPNKKDSIQLETLARIIPWYLKERFKNSFKIDINDNIEYTEDIVSLDIYGRSVIAVHGDKEKPNQVIDKLTTFTGKSHDLICLAHYHHFSCDEKNRTMLVSNGSLMGTDDYSLDLRLDSLPSQTLIISDPVDVCKSIYKINLYS